VKGTAEDGWQPFHEEEGVVIHEKTLPDSSIQIIKAIGTLKGVDLEQLWRALYNAPLEEKKKISDDILSHKVLKEIDDNVHVSYTQYNASTGISGREFVQVRAHRKLEDGSHLLTVTSINYKDQPFGEGFVRGIVRSGSLYTPIPGTNNVSVVNVDHIDPKGWIPQVVVNAFKKKASQRILKLQRVYGSQ